MSESGKPDLAFDRAEFDQRLATARKALSDQEIDVAILMAPEVQYWLTGYDTFLGAQLPQALILTPGDDEPTLVVWDADVSIVHATSLVRDIRTYLFGVDAPSDLFARVALEKSPGAGRVGLDMNSQAVTYGFGCELDVALGHAFLVDVTESLARLRAIKSPAEVDLMRLAGRHARAGLETARSAVRPGMTEVELAAEIEYAMRADGSDYFSLPTEMTGGSRSVLAHGTPRHHVLQAGDLVHLEIGGVAWRYNCVGMQTFVVPGAAAKPEAIRLYDSALTCLRTGLAMLQPGVAAADVEAPALAILRERGLGDAFKMRFGYGVGIGFPPTWLEPLKITRTSNDVLHPGTTFVLHVCLLDAASRSGVLVGGTYLMTESGYELLSGAGDVPLFGT